MTKVRGKKPVKEQQNLRRFKDSVTAFVSSSGKQDGRVFEKKSSTLTRKQKRKEERQMKKKRKKAFSERKPVPTLESIQKDKQKIDKEERDKMNEEKKRQRKKEQKKRKRAQKSKTVELKKQAMIEANKKEDKIINQLEKQMKLNKRKSKQLPKSFSEDGLDYLLDIVDPEKVKYLYGKEDDDDEDAPVNWGKLSADDIEVVGSDEEMASDSEMEISENEDSDMPESEDEEDSEEFEEEEEEHGEKEMDIQMSGSRDLRDSEVQESDMDSDKRPQTSCLKGKGSKSEKEEKKVTFSDSKKSKVATVLQTKSLEESKKAKRHIHNDFDENISEDDEFTSDDTEGFDESGEESETGTSVEMEPKLKEDIYGRLRDESGHVVNDGSSGAYIPPAKRLLMAKGIDEKKKLELERMKKQIKGLVNRVSEATLQPVSSQLEDLYRGHSRADVTEVLSQVVMEACVAHTLVPDRLSMELTMLVAVVHGNVGSEVGATFLQNAAKKFDSCYHANSNYGDGKEIDNVVMVIAHLYNFKVVHALLVLDLLKRFIENFKERDIMLILLLLRNIGFTLRKDDPQSLKQIILDIQAKASTVDTSTFQDQSRVKFMLEVLMAIKNNNMRKIPNFDPSHMEHLRKLLRNYVRGGSSSAETQLRISLEDLLHAEEKGRWWVVGSAWTGRDTDRPDVEGSNKTWTSVVGDVSAQILELARKQRMNTDVRRNIFCILMTSEDFVDAFEKLLRLGLKQKQEREIIHVILDVALQEKSWNPFYAFLTQKFCEYDKRFTMTLQFSLWDKFKVLSEMLETSIHNLASLLSFLVATKAMSLSVFKVIEFADLDKPRVRFMKKCLSSLLLDHPEHVVREVFLRISPLPKLAFLREGLKLFMRHFLLKGKAVSDDKLQELRTRIEIAEKSMSSEEGSLRL